MKKLQKWIIAGVALIVLLVGGYFISSSLGNQTSQSPTTTSQEQLKTLKTQITIDYAGFVDKKTEVEEISIEDGQTAWDALKKAVGEDNIEYKDYGRDMGIFVTALNGVKPTGGRFWLFNINGNGADVGPSSYKVQDGDKLEFVISQPSAGQ